MSVVDDTRKLLQDLIAPELREIKGELVAIRAELKGESGEIRADIKRLEQKMDSQYAALLNALTIDKRLTMLEQAQQAQTAQANNPKLA